MRKIKVVDLFAGPGGLGEGFARFSPNETVEYRPFDIVCSAEKDPAAIRTLRLRTFYRLCEACDGVPGSYFEYLRGKRDLPYDDSTEKLWDHACREASPIELGTETGDVKLREALNRHLKPGEDWVLIGGPPCQAYSLVGRSRNRGISGYDPTRDQRNFLYEHYLEILARHQPVAFIMENVKGLLSSRVGSQQMFPRILSDLTNPGKPAGTRARPKYTIHALATSSAFSLGDEYSSLNPGDFVIRSEDHGIPQARHRVILLGIRTEAGLRKPFVLQPQLDPMDSWLALRTLPELRSGISKTQTTTREWADTILQTLKECRRNGLDPELADRMREAFMTGYREDLQQGKPFMAVSRLRTGARRAEIDFLRSITNSKMGVYPNLATDFSD